ncbi:hypothetical protein [Actinomadura sp. CNU-125]|nr:hypothetical protein [Actinomadura sp. CNU-125]
MSSRPVNAGDEASDGGLPLWPPALAALVLLAAAARTVWTMRFRKQK